MTVVSTCAIRAGGKRNTLSGHDRAARPRQRPDDYRHYPKLIEPAEELALPRVRLKWYDVLRAEASIDPAVSADARHFLRAQAEAGKLKVDDELGFVILHVCGESFFFLIVCTWRNANEMWETVYAKDTAIGGPFELVPNGTHKPMMCVWELGAVLHEREAWTRYLCSPRDAQAAMAYLGDRFSGPA